MVYSLSCVCVSFAAKILKWPKYHPKKKRAEDLNKMSTDTTSRVQALVAKTLNAPGFGQIVCDN